MIFPYWPVQVKAEGSTSETELIYRPLIPVHLITSHDVTSVWALADTGADETLIPASLADAIKMNYQDKDRTTMIGFGGRKLRVVFGTVDLVIADGEKRYQWSTRLGVVKFEKPADEIVILGHKGALDFFRTTFDGEKRQIELLPNASFPGTISKNVKP